MRTDPSRDKDFVFSKEWGGGLNRFDIRLFEREKPVDGEGPPFRSAPFSGGERNRLFIQRNGNFDDLTLVSGVDFREDGRGFALFDYDQDGFNADVDCDDWDAAVNPEEDESCDGIDKNAVFSQYRTI